MKYMLWIYLDDRERCWTTVDDLSATDMESATKESMKLIVDRYVSNSTYNRTDIDSAIILEVSETLELDSLINNAYKEQDEINKQKKIEREQASKAFREEYDRSEYERLCKKFGAK